MTNPEIELFLNNTVEKILTQAAISPVLIIGPMSSFKTTLAKKIAFKLKTNVVTASSSFSIAEYLKKNEILILDETHFLEPQTFSFTSQNIIILCGLKYKSTNEIWFSMESMLSMCALFFTSKFKKCQINNCPFPATHDSIPSDKKIINFKEKSNYFSTCDFHNKSGFFLSQTIPHDEFNTNPIFQYHQFSERTAAFSFFPHVHSVASSRTIISSAAK